MTKYAKLKGNQIELTPSPLIGDGWAAFGEPKPEQYAELGYLPVVESEKPVRDGYYYIPYYEQHWNEIIQKWQEHEIQMPEQSPQDYLWQLLMG